MQAKPFQCRDCGSVDGYRSRPRTFSERFLLPAFFLRPVRCADCFRLYYLPVFVQVRDRREPRATSNIAA